MSNILIVPGLHGSGPTHWQTWFESRLSGCLRVTQTDWSDPHLPRWADRVRHGIKQAPGSVWIIAHSFGCLATIVAALDCPGKIAGLMLVAPADPDKFGVTNMLPEETLGFPSVVVASTNDPWMRFTRSAFMAEKFGSRFISLGAAGHINTESGYGPWLDGIDIFEGLRKAHSELPLGTLSDTEQQLFVHQREWHTKTTNNNPQK
jgi:uncharacterized protein